MFHYSGKTALVTGASTGIGATFARMLAAQGTNLILVARSEDKLQVLATELTARNNIHVHVLPEDLSKDGAATQLARTIHDQHLHVDILINNAGFATHGMFETLPVMRDHDQVMVNVVSVVDLTHTFIPAMLQKGEGIIINVSSTAGFQPVPYMAVYGASKAFVLSFSEALWAEYRKRGIRVLALCPGPTRTPFFDIVGEDAKVGNWRSSEQVVATALRAVAKRRATVVDGFANYVQTCWPRIFPRQIIAQISANLLQPRGDQKSISNQ